MAEAVLNITTALQQTTRLFLDTAPIIYFVERNPAYIDLVRPVFYGIDAGNITALTSPVTLAEALIVPFRSNNPQLQQTYFELIVNGPNTRFAGINADDSRHAAELRARYNLALPDAFQLAVAISNGCDTFLTNDDMFRRVSELHILILNNLEV